MSATGDSPPAEPEAEGEAAAIAPEAAIDDGGDPQTPAPAIDDGGDPHTPAPAIKRKKRRRRDEAAAAPVAAVAEGVEIDESVPAFARAWPQDAALTALVTAFEAGDYARVRREAPALARGTEDPAVRRAARELRRRLDPDPVAVYMLMAAAALLAFLAGWYWLHPHIP